jgi:hypothetical protein
MQQWLPALAAGLVVTATAVIHGFWTGRWDEVSAAPVYGPALDNIPLQIGEWQGQALDLDARESARYSEVLYRRYVNKRTGGSVAVVLVSGRPGPVSIHAPDYCYPASGYNAEAWTLHKVVFDPAHPPAEFKTGLVTKTQASSQTQLRVMWSWYASGSWSVPDNPRLAFAGQRTLYKIHLVREALSTQDDLENDPSGELVRELLAAFQRLLGALE